MKKLIVLSTLMALCASFGCQPESAPNPTSNDRPVVKPDEGNLPKGVIGFPAEPL